MIASSYDQVDSSRKISIIIPCYNTGNWLPSCIDSILNQSYHNYELVLVNDGSIDSTPQICDGYTRQDERVKTIHQNNEGVVAARYSGFNCSTGNIILFLDSDDKLMPNALTIISNNYIESHCDLLRFGFHYCSEKWVCYATTLPPKEGLVDRDQLMRDLSCPLKIFSSSSIWDKAYSRDLVRQVFSRIRHVKLRHSEDMLFSLYALVLSRSTYFLKQPLYMYLQRVGSVIHSQNPNAIQDKSRYLCALLGLYDALNGSYRSRVDQLLIDEASESVTYAISNSATYSASFASLSLTASQITSSFWYHRYVRFRQWKLKRLLRDVLLVSPSVFAVAILLRKRLLQ